MQKGAYSFHVSQLHISGPQRSFHTLISPGGNTSWRLQHGPGPWAVRLGPWASGHGPTTDGRADGWTGVLAFRGFISTHLIRKGMRCWTHQKNVNLEGLFALQPLPGPGGRAGPSRTGRAADPRPFGRRSAGGRQAAGGWHTWNPTHKRPCMCMSCFLVSVTHAPTSALCSLRVRPSQYIIDMRDANLFVSCNCPWDLIWHIAFCAMGFATRDIQPMGYTAPRPDLL